MRYFPFLAGMIVFLTALYMPTAYATMKSPTCVMLKFSNNTRFKALDADEVLSDLVLEKMLASNLFQIKETRPLDDELMTKIYDNDINVENNMRAAMEQGDFDALFDGAGFNNDKASSVDNATEGQWLDRSVTSAIGEAHGANYLVQGTIINMGRGSWLNQDLEQAKVWGGIIGSLIPGGAAFTQAAVGSIQDKKTGVGVQSALRIIRADTGEVVWSKIVTTVCKQDKTGALGVYAGSDRLSMDHYSGAMDQAAQEIVDALVEALKKGVLFK